MPGCCCVRADTGPPEGPADFQRGSYPDLDESSRLHFGRVTPVSTSPRQVRRDRPPPDFHPRGGEIATNLPHEPHRLERLPEIISGGRSTEPLGQLGLGAGDEVPEPVSLEPQSQPLDRVVVRRVAPQIHRLEVMPVDPPRLVPRGVVHDQELSLAFHLGHGLGQLI